MFLHIYRFRILCKLRNTTNLFWMLGFPIILASLFQFTLGNLMSGDAFKQIPLAVVDNSQWQTQSYLQDALTTIEASEEPLFQVQYVTKARAQQLLDEELISGYIEADNQPRLVVKENGINQSIIKSFLDQVQVLSITATTMIGENPAVLNQGFLDDLSNPKSYVAQSANQAKPNGALLNFYTIFSMTCFFVSFMGIDEVRVTQANQSAQAARVAVAPTNKAVGFFAGLCASMTIQIFVISLLFVYVKYGLGVAFGGQLPAIALTCFLGSLCGLLFGSTLATIVNANSEMTENISAATTMFLSAMAGMMSIELKYIVERAFPLARSINPVNLISDSLYTLYYFDTMDRYWINIGCLALICIVFGFTSISVLRRQRYASL